MVYSHDSLDLPLPARRERTLGLVLHAALTDDAPCTTALSTARALGKELERVALRNGWRR